MKTIILDKWDINNPLFPSLWENICDDLGLGPKTKYEEYPERIVLQVKEAFDGTEE